MDILFTMLIWSILMIFIVYFSVRLAIYPLLNKSDEIASQNKEYGLIKLRDMEVLSNTELEEVIKLYQSKEVRNENYEQYQNYVRVLNELKGFGYFSDEQYSGKISKLKNYFKID